MADYIEREEAFNVILKLVPKVDGDGYCWVIRGDAAQAIDSIPSADVQPIVHGEWIDIFQREDPDTSVECRCSICEKASRRPVGKYCKWCGARMDGGT